MNVIETHDVIKRYSSRAPALNRVNLTVAQGTVLGLLGRNGAGKSTLIKLLMAMLHPTAGEVRVFDRDPWSDHQGIKRRIGYLSEDQILPPYLKIREIFDLYAGCYPSWDAAFAARWRERFALDANQKLGKFSKGQQRQVGLITATAHRPELLILDEPGGGLDAVVRREFLEVVIELLHDAGASVFFSSHYISDVERIAGHVAVLHKGAVLLDKPLDELRESYCQVLLPADFPGGEPAVRARPECVAIQRTGSSFKVVLSVGQEAARGLVSPFLRRPGDFQGINMNLEDIFINLVGGEL